MFATFRITALAAIAAGLACVSANQARADLVLEYSLDNGMTAAAMRMRVVLA
jgi:hypothetical protein